MREITRPLTVSNRPFPVHRCAAAAKPRRRQRLRPAHARLGCCARAQVGIQKACCGGYYIGVTMRCGVGVVSPGVVSAPRSHRRRRHVRRCAVLEEGPELGAMGGCVVCAAAEGRGTQGASRWFAGLLTGIINYLASSQQKQQIIEQNGGRRAFECARQSTTPFPKRSAWRWFRSRENGRVGAPRFRNAPANGRSPGAVPRNGKYGAIHNSRPSFIN